MIKQSANGRLPLYMWAIGLVALAILVGVAMRFWNTFTPTQPAAPASAAAPANAATQLSEGGQVTIKATWQGPSAGPVFAVAMDTHAVGLDGYDLKRQAALRVDGGSEVQPEGWDAPEGGHHRQGTLTFPPTVAGRPLIGSHTRTIELVIRDVAGVPERIFRWTL